MLVSFPLVAWAGWQGESLSRAGQATILDQTIVILSTMVYALGEHWQRSSAIHDGSSHCVRVCGV